MSALLEHVVHVLSLGAEKKMVRIATGRVVTVMAHAQVSRKMPKRQGKGEAMSGHYSISSIKLPIPMTRSRSLPRPASIGSTTAVNFRQEPFLPRYDFLTVMEARRAGKRATRWRRTMLHLRGVDGEVVATLGTNEGNKVTLSGHFQCSNHWMRSPWSAQTTRDSLYPINFSLALYRDGRQSRRRE